MTITMTSETNAPTNPKFLQTGATNNNRLFLTITTNNESTATESVYNNTENSTLSTTKGFRIKCYNALTTEGLRFNPTDFENADPSLAYHYFVLIHSDDDKKHHFARITEILTEDEYGDAFEFEPKLGNEIAKDTKYIIVKGPSKDKTNHIAVSYGLLQDSSSMNLAQNMVCARPLFYFFNDRLDKDNELDHNTKYEFDYDEDTDLSATGSGNNGQLVFRTSQDYGNLIVDYSKYTHRVTLTDKLRTLDDDNSGTITTNEGSSLTANTASYNFVYPNAQRYSLDGIASGRSSSHTPVATRYLHYDYSPTRSNFLYNVISHENSESIDGKGGFSETKLVDNARIMPSKIKEFYAYRVRHNILRGDLNEFFSLKATYSSNSGNVYTFDTEYDLEEVLSDGDEIKLGNNIFIIEDFGSLSGNTQTITVENNGSNPYVRGENGVVFAASATTPSSGDVLQRRAYNQSNGTLMLDIALLNSRFSKMYVGFSSLNHTERFATITACDANKGMITLSFSDDSYTGRPLSFAFGEYRLYIERFNGEIENIETKKENGQTMMYLQGRDKLNALLSPVLNLNTLFSEDIIYSTNSPYNKLSLLMLSGTTVDIENSPDAALGDRYIDTGTINVHTVPVVGDKLYTEFGYIGIIKTVVKTSSPLPGKYEIYITTNNNIDYTNAVIYLDTEKNYVLNKALGSSHLNDIKPSSLLGSANKGLIFTSGHKISNGTEESVLTGTSISSAEGAVGYPINNPSGISSDNLFQSKLKDEGDTNNEASFDTINTLIDFEIVSINQKENNTQIELAPYVPISLGRKMDNFGSNGNEITLTKATELRTRSSIANNILTVKEGLTTLPTASASLFKRGDPVFVGADTSSAVFVGYVRSLRVKAGNNPLANGDISHIYMDRDLPIPYVGASTTGDNVYTVSKNTHDLFLINGAHLWGGKILTMPHSKNTSIGPVALNFKNIHNNTDDIDEKFGQFIYKTICLSKGNFNLLGSRSGGRFHKRIYDNSSKLKYHSLSYKIKPNTSTSNLNIYDIPAQNALNHLDIDMRGIESVYGSISKGSERVATPFSLYPDISGVTRLATENVWNAFSQFDTSAATLFLYINSDLLPYSSLRTDSIMNGTKSLQNYNLFLIQNKEAFEGELEYTDTSSGKKKLLNDNSFETISFNSSQNISSLKRFGLMRLTEICLDAHFNIFNPEKPTVSNSNYLKVSDMKIYTRTDTNADIDVSASLSAADDEIVVDAIGTISVNDQLYDTNLKFIGEVNSISGTTITLDADAILNDEGSFTAGSLFTLTETTATFRGTRDKNTFLNEDYVHIQKGALITQEYQNATADKWNTRNGAILSFGADDNAVSSVRISTTSSLPSSAYYPTRALEAIFETPSIYKQLSAVILETYDIEEGNTVSVQAGTVLPFSDGRIETNTGVTSPYNYNTHFSAMGHNSSDSDKFENFAYKFPDLTANTLATDSNYEATGIKYGLKPRLYHVAADNPSSTIQSSNGDVYQYQIDTTNSENSWLDLVDITGHYLVSEDGCDTILEQTVSQTTNNKEFTGSRTMEGVIPKEMVYVLSHSISHLGQHSLVLDNTLTDLKAYRILKPNETTFHAKTPKKITLNMLSSEYTKMPNSENMYSVNQDIDILEGTRGRTTTEDGPRREAFLSMYVAVDIDKQSSNEDYLVLRKAKNFTDILSEGNHSLYLSDGETGYSSSINVIKQNEYSTFSEEEIILTFSEIQPQDGIVSISETFTVNSRQTINIDANRACVGTTVNIGLEGEDLINELLEQEGIEFETTTTGSPFFLAPNYQGVDLYSAIRLITERKKMKLVEENGVFKITPERYGDNITNIVIDDSGDFSIFEFEKVSTLFDFYNEITVYGNSHKSVRKDIRSIQKRGRKSLEVIDTTLLTQSETDEEATKLIRLHSQLNQKLSFIMDSKGISQLRVGDIVTVEIPKENIPLANFIVLEMNHRLDGLIRLELGRYSKGLEDVFSELFVSNKQTKASLRNKELISNEIGYNFLETLKVKDLRLLIRTRTAGGGFKFGFSTAFNTASTAFTQGAISYTTLLDEDLA